MFKKLEWIPNFEIKGFTLWTLLGLILDFNPETCLLIYNWIIIGIFCNLKLNCVADVCMRVRSGGMGEESLQSTRWAGNTEQ